MAQNILTKQEIERYKRQISLPEIGIEGQQKLKEAKILVVGAGGLGSPVLYYLAAAGVGIIGIVDSNVVEENNLPRQILYWSDDVGKLKALMAWEKLSLVNPYVKFDINQIKFTKENADELVDYYDIIVDCCDNFETRYLINDTCKKFIKPMVYGATYKYEGQVSVFDFNGGPTYRHLYPEPPGNEAENSSQFGLLGILPGIIGTIQATETIKIITGIGDILKGKLLIFNVLNMKSSIIKISETG